MQEFNNPQQPQQQYPQYPQQPQQQYPQYPEQQQYNYPPQNTYPQAPPPPPKKKSRKRLWIIMGVVVLALIIISGIGSALGSAGGSSNTAQSTPTAQPTQAQPTQAPTQAQPTQAPLTWKTTHSYTGSGIKKTETFTAPGDWKIIWSCTPSSFYGNQYNVQVYVYNSDGSIADLGINEICSSSNTHGETEEHQRCDVYLDINSEGSWTIQVQEQK